MSTDFVKIEIKDSIAFLTIDKESSFNALNTQVLDEMKSQLRLLHANKEVRGLIITGAGEKAFIAGADIKEMAQMDDREAQNFSELGQQVTKLLEGAPFPTIAAVNGFALGGGLEMAISCDYMFCTPNAALGLPEVSLGLIPGFGGTQRLARAIGRNRAKEMIFTGRKVKAEEAKAIGLCLDIFEDKRTLLNFCEQNLRYCIKNSPLAIKEAKRVLNAGIETDLAKGMSIEASTFAELFNSFDMKEGTAAFVEKRQAAFKGE